MYQSPGIILTNVYENQLSDGRKVTKVILGFCESKDRKYNGHKKKYQHSSTEHQTEKGKLSETNPT
jgi:hypothetical protein